MTSNYRIEYEDDGTLVLNPPEQHGLEKVWTDGDNVFIEPCGDCPDGYLLLVEVAQDLLETGKLYPHFYDESPDSLRFKYVAEEGIGFDIAAESESIESDEIWKLIHELEDGVYRNVIRIRA